MKKKYLVVKAERAVTAQPPQDEELETFSVDTALSTEDGTGSRSAVPGCYHVRAKPHDE